MNYFKFLLILLFLIPTINGQLFAIVYENGEDKSSKRWKLLEASLSGTVENIYDKHKESRVIQLKGKGTKSAYQLMTNDGLTWENIAENHLQWEMNYHEDFVIIVGMDTKGGKRYLIYTPSDEDGYMQYGLGKSACRGVWQTFSRNLQEDLNQFEELNDIKRVNSFVVRGSGYIDNVEMSKKPFIEYEQKPIKELDRAKKSQTNSVPTIDIDGENPLRLKRGELYIDSGATAYDKEDGELTVVSSHDIDIYQEGRYSVMYIATDSEGNTAVDTRYVEVGSLTKKAEEHTDKVDLEEQEMLVAEEHYEDELKLDERELEVRAWEKELELREKELTKREHQMEEKAQFLNEAL